MSLRNALGPPRRSRRPIAREFGVVTVVLVGLFLWQHLVQRALTAAFGTPAFGDVLVGGLVNGVLLLGGLVAFAGAYAAVRNLDWGLALPSTADLPTVGLTALAPVALVALTKLVGVVTGVPYNSLTKTAVAADASLLPVALLAGIGLLVGVPALVVTCQVLVQRSFERAVGADGAVALTTLVTGFAMVSTIGGLTPVPDSGKLAGVALFAGLLGVALYATERATRDWLRYLGCAPLVAFVAVVALSGIAQVESVAGGLYALTQIAVLGVAAYGYDRTGSLLVPALAYTSSLLASRTVVVVFEAGMQSW